MASRHARARPAAARKPSASASGSSRSGGGATRFRSGAAGGAAGSSRRRFLFWSTGGFSRPAAPPTACGSVSVSQSLIQIFRGDSSVGSNGRGLFSRQSVSRVRRRALSGYARQKEAQIRRPALASVLRPLATRDSGSKHAAKPARYKLQYPNYEQNKRTPSRRLRRPHARPLSRNTPPHVRHALII